jgi:hypothetical protein
VPSIWSFRTSRRKDGPCTGWENCGCAFGCFLIAGRKGSGSMPNSPSPGKANRRKQRCRNGPHEARSAALRAFAVVSYIFAHQRNRHPRRVWRPARTSPCSRAPRWPSTRSPRTGRRHAWQHRCVAARPLHALRNGPLDPLVFVAVMTMLLSVACAAYLLPAWRASRLDPMAALRTE